MNRKFSIFVKGIVTLMLLNVMACGTDCKDNCPEEPTFKPFAVPANFPATTAYTGEPTAKSFDLGKALFYDPMLSVDSTISCGSCHQQSAAFAHDGHDISHGVNNLIGTRNSPAIQNLAWMTTFFWDGGVGHLDLQPFAPIENPVEMAEKLSRVMHKIRRSPKYPAMFKAAFADVQDTSDITTAKMGVAFAHFMKMLVSANSRYDKYIRGEGEVLTQSELNGLQVFTQKCATCHSGDLFTDFSFRNNGRPITSDSGRMHITLNPDDRYKFKVPTLRNIEKTAPYMHNGGLSSLTAVLNFYATNVQNTPNLDPILNQNGVLGIPLSETEKTDIIAFLRTLTDNDFLKDKRFAE